MNADNIAVMDKGLLVEQGTHDSLMGIGGVYSSLVARQVIVVITYRSYKHGAFCFHHLLFWMLMDTSLFCATLAVYIR